MASAATPALAGKGRARELQGKPRLGARIFPGLGKSGSAGLSGGIRAASDSNVRPGRTQGGLAVLERVELVSGRRAATFRDKPGRSSHCRTAAQRSEKYQTGGCPAL